MCPRDLAEIPPGQPARGASMGLATVALLLSMCIPRAASAEEAPLIRADLVAHFGASALIAVGGYALGATLLEEPWARLGLGLGAGLAAGLAKEAADLAGYGSADWMDLVADLMGALTGAFIAWAIDRALASGGRRRCPSLAPRAFEATTALEGP